MVTTTSVPAFHPTGWFSDTCAEPAGDGWESVVHVRTSPEMSLASSSCAPASAMI